MSKRIASTDKIELVETHNLFLALSNLSSTKDGYTSLRIKRALYHALIMENTLSNTSLTAIRVALELP